MSKSYRVVPDGNGWEVQKASRQSASHRTVSSHRKKARAKSKARQLASSGDRLVVLQSNGAIQSSVKVR
jgi:hypothetical protein